MAKEEIHTEESGLVFELVKRGGGPALRDEDFRVSILSKGALSLNRTAVEWLEATDGRVEFLFAPEERVIGIRAAEPDSPHSAKLVELHAGGAYHVSARTLLKRYGIPYERSTRYPVKRDHDDEGRPMLLVDIKQGGEDVSGPGEVRAQGPGPGMRLGW